MKGGEVIIEEEDRKIFSESFPKNNKKPMNDLYLDLNKELKIYSNKKEISLKINIED